MKSMAKKRSEMNKKPRIEHGNVELPENEFDPRQAKFRVTMWVDLDLLDEVRKRAGADGMKYQPWINKKLRETILGENSLENRIAALEAAVFKKAVS
jgi:predicted DNA binding CopG/RHH family protein